MRVTPGRTLVYAENGTFQFYDVVLRVQALLHGTVIGDTIHLEENDIAAALPVPGDSGIFWLFRRRDPEGRGLYRLINSQGRFLEHNGVLVASDDQAEWARDLESSSLEDLRGRIQEATGAIARGEIEPAAPVVPLPTHGD